MKNILITGGAGFIGSTITEKLYNKGYNVTILDNLSVQIHGLDPEKNSQSYNKIKNKCRFVLGSVLEVDKLNSVLEGQDAVIHLAAETGTGQSMYEINKYTEVNLTGTSLLLDYIVNKKHHIQKVIIASSRSIYGEGKYFSKDLNSFVYPKSRIEKDMLLNDFEIKYPNNNSPLELVATDEESKIHPSSIYGITKQTQEQMVLTACGSVGVPAIAFRYQNVYGPGQSLNNPYTGVLSIFSNLINSGKGLNIFEDGLESRDFVHVQDVADATIAGLENSTIQNDVFNVGNGVATSILEVANQLMINYKKEVPVTITGNFRIGDIRHNYADITKINKYLNFKPNYNFETGIQEFCKWVMSQEAVESNFEASLEEMKLKKLFK